jgi:dephospho-CoA kinase
MAGIANRTERPVIGITGGMGSGKSSVARYLHQHFGGISIDADAVCRELLEPEAAGWELFRKAFGAEYLNTDRSINRPLLRRAIFGEERVRRRLESLLHPLAKEEIARRVRTETGPGWFLIEVPLLFEAGWDRETDRVIVVYAHPERCRERLMKRDRMSAAEATAAIATQWPLAAKATRADHVIDNSSNWAVTCLQVLHLGELLLQPPVCGKSLSRG